eukprot:gnl/TRDRNA2_/TRDRNA2_180256_c0_seq1.p1 gnl/TRDRNA2_/TRDRNA2_180256_c0~~gnl/TRDRNA2_/TRDRNA2_180256_c0_seq1.p1  ORF type:complete len:345 (-),score=59.96 gnl/TRDRNA2_/TRDRNA2_180256_c0_seq1:209-1243(-)
MQSIARILSIVGPVAASRIVREKQAVVSKSSVQGPDPECKTGLLSFDRKICCASYCGECSDYPTCESVNGQSSWNSCCKSAIADLECGKGATASVCLMTCSKAVPPCIMDIKITIPAVARNAADDANKAVKHWRAKAAAAIAPQPPPLAAPDKPSTLEPEPSGDPGVKPGPPAAPDKKKEPLGDPGIKPEPPAAPDKKPAAPYAKRSDIPGACVPSPKVPDNGRCLFGDQCASGFCCPFFKSCLGNEGYTPLPYEVVKEDPIRFEIMWAPECGDSGCDVCDMRDGSAGFMCKEVDMGNGAGPVLAGNPFGLDPYDITNPECKCDDRFNAAFLAGTWVKECMPAV